MSEVKVIEAILCTKERRGNGKSWNSPVRVVTQVYKTTGELIAEDDPNGRYRIEDLAEFVVFLHARQPIDLSEASVHALIEEFGKRKLSST